MADEFTAREIVAPVLIAAGVVGVSFLLALSVRRKVARRRADRPSARQVVQQLSRRPAADEADAQMARLVETARRLAAQLDDKAERLEQLIRHADERLEKLSRPSEGPAPRRSPPSVRRPASTGAPPRASGLDPLTRSVYELADAGRSPLEIAQQLDEQVGKVELILALRAA